MLFYYEDVTTIRRLSGHVLQKNKANSQGHEWVCLNEAMNLYTRPTTEADKSEKIALGGLSHNNDPGENG
ncbi:hypothetical protein KUL156_18590 [Alteromonas sp. KUL156]|nr:hypothetical protein KUL154_45050 [Alteromonas sp. KUL154]GFD99266.1 hypothetical protein KUL156_18590 [Alteromonas sp. KUL156]